MSIRTLIAKHPKLTGLAFWTVNHLPFNNSIRKKGNKITGGLMTRCRIRIRGSNNQIILGSGTWLNKCRLTIKGSNCRIVIGDDSVIRQGDLYIEDDGGQIIVGQRTAIYGNTHLACIEGKTISIGDDGLISSNVTMRVGDSHSILDLEGNRINPSQDVQIADRVWIGNQVTILKGAKVPEDAVIATGAIVTKQFSQTGIVLGGNPAKVIKENIRWDKKRL